MCVLVCARERENVLNSDAVRREVVEEVQAVTKPDQTIDLHHADFKL